MTEPVNIGMLKYPSAVVHSKGPVAVHTRCLIDVGCFFHNYMVGTVEADFLHVHASNLWDLCTK